MININLWTHKGFLPFPCRPSVEQEWKKTLSEIHYYSMRFLQSRIVIWLEDHRICWLNPICELAELSGHISDMSKSWKMKRVSMWLSEWQNSKAYETEKWEFMNSSTIWTSQGTPALTHLQSFILNTIRFIQSESEEKQALFDSFVPSLNFKISALTDVNAYKY